MRWTRQAQCVYALAVLATAACGSTVQTHDSAAPAMTQPATAGVSAVSGTPSMGVSSNGGAAGSRSASPAAGSGNAAPAAASSNKAGASPAAPGGNAAGSAPAANGGNTAAAGSSPAAGSGGAAGSSADPTGSGIPCPVFKALADACQTCHGRVPANGAPMSLVEIADFRVLSVGSPKIPKSQLALMRIDGSRRPPMPPEGWPITDDDKKTLLDWLRAGAPDATADNATCH